ncbi:uncharacterized protein Pyn_09672 [Prunus yedoensis var. nudiflora]|uniref:Uncharacterized protein n=1 Tax=Prunus yedoensis var. nudiflora TaxID=2094558 RepID=A0A314XXG9_PRUYE|nr:uncharacterized protein Pyn_09672 [Prunus yedoensis var. nudiflora]
MNVKDAGDAMKCRAFSRCPPNYLINIRQGPKEKLRDYVNCFNREVISISCSKDTTYTAILAGFRRGHFLFHVNKFPPKSYEDLVSKGYRYDIAEEMTYDTLEGKDLSQPSEGDKWREGRNDDEIEALIRQGSLNRFMGEKKKVEQDDNTLDKQPRATKDINIISEGATVAGDSNKVRK